MNINEHLCSLSNVYSGAQFNLLLENYCILFQQVTHISTDVSFRETSLRLFFTIICVTKFKSDKRRFHVIVTNKIRGKLSN